MNKAIDLLFIAHGNKNFGTGHLSRCVKIYHFLKDKTVGNIEMLFLGHIDSYGEGLVKENGLDIIKLPSQDLREIERKVAKIKPKIIINDNFAHNPLEYYELLKKYCQFLIVLDDSQYAQVIADVLINVDPNKYISKPTRKKLIFLQGLKYLILPYQIDVFRYDISGDILVFFGGTDFRDRALDLATLIASQMKDKKITVIASPKRGLPTNVTVVKPFTYPITSLLKFHNIIVTSGGTAMFESIYFKKPTFAFACQPWEKENIRYLEEKDLVKYIGSYEYYPEYLLENFLDLLKTPLNFAFNKNLIDGKGVVRIGSVILKMLR